MTVQVDIDIATWNVQHGGKAATVRKILREQLAAGVTIFLLQEVKPHTIALFEAEGLSVTRTAHASNAVAWVTKTGQSLIRRKGIVLAPDYIDKTSNPDRRIRTHSPDALLKTPSGVTVEALSFHKPSRVQRPNAESERMKVSRAATATISRAARASGANLFVAGGDDNVHLTGSAKWDYLRNKSTGMIRVAPPRGTHAGGRKIDVFYLYAGPSTTIKVLKQWTTSGGGDHQLHKMRVRVTVNANVKPAPMPAPKPKPKPKPLDRMNPKSYYVGAHGDHVKWLAGRLVVHGYGRFYKNGTDRGFTKGEDLKAVRQFQLDQGWRGKDADGLPGKVSLAQLSAEPKRKKKPSAPAKAAVVIKALVRPTRLPDNYPAILRKLGVPVVEIPGWQKRRRPGLFTPVGTLWHHWGAHDKIGDAAEDRRQAEWLAKVGRPDLSAPLAQGAISLEGVFYLCAAGRSNHAGKAKAHGSVVKGDGNRLYVGFECMNDGKQGFPKSQRDTMVTVAYATHALLGTSTRALAGHKETSITGKWDPGNFDMNKFRADVARRLAGK